MGIHEKLRDSAIVPTQARKLLFEILRGKAERSIAGLRQHYPKLTLTEVSQGLPPLPRTYCDRLVEGLQGAGLPR